MTKPKVCLWHEMVSFSRKWLSSLIVFYDYYYDDRPTTTNCVSQKLTESTTITTTDTDRHRGKLKCKIPLQNTVMCKRVMPLQT